jgi:hypothetical protein
MIQAVTGPTALPSTLENPWYSVASEVSVGSTGPVSFVTNLPQSYAALVRLGKTHLGCPYTEVSFSQ